MLGKALTGKNDCYLFGRKILLFHAVNETYPQRRIKPRKHQVLFGKQSLKPPSHNIPTQTPQEESKLAEPGHRALLLYQEINSLRGIE